MTKEFKTVKQQLELLKSRGLKVDNDEAALDFLKFNNYYRISGYSLTLRNHDVFYSTASMQSIVDIYEFDHELRIQLLSILEKIEVNVKSVFAYRFAEQYGPLGYKDSSLFNDEEQYNRIAEKLQKQKENRLRDEAYLQHFIIDLKEEIPLWAYVDLFSFSDISLMYQMSPDHVKTMVADDFGLSGKKAASLMGKFLHGLTIVRNLCAHESRIYNRLFRFKANLNKNDLMLLRKDKHGNPDNEKVFGYFLVIRRLAKTKDWKQFKDAIIGLADQYPSVWLKNYGFPDNWREVL